MQTLSLLVTAVLSWIVICSCSSEFPAFARPPAIDAGADDAGHDAPDAD